MAWASFALPSAARCDRPREAPESLSKVHVGGLAQGPDEKRGFSGRVAGFDGAITGILTDMRPSLGKGVPRIGLLGSRGFRKRRNVARPPLDAPFATAVTPIGNTFSGFEGRDMSILGKMMTRSV